MIFKVKTRYYTDDGKPVGKSVIIRKDIDVNDIRSVEEIYAHKRGQMQYMKTKCKLVCNPPIGDVVVEKSFEQMQRILEQNAENEVFVIGFKRYD